MGKAVEGLFSDLSKIDPEQVVEGFTGVFEKVIGGLQWLFEHQNDVVTALEVILGGWAMLKITKHKWCSFKGAFCLTAVRSTVTIPFAIVSALLVCYNPLFGIILFALAIFWSMGHLYTAIMAGADRTSGNRSAAWFPPILIIMYLLTAAVMIAVIIYTGVTLYYQLSDMVNFYISYFSDLFAGL